MGIDLGAGKVIIDAGLMSAMLTLALEAAELVGSASGTDTTKAMASIGLMQAFIAGGN